MVIQCTARPIAITTLLLRADPPAGSPSPARRPPTCLPTPFTASPQVKQALIAFGSQRPGLPSFLRNKVAQTIVSIAAVEYPDVWPSFFHDVVGTLGQGAGAVDLFCR